MKASEPADAVYERSESHEFAAFDSEQEYTLIRQVVPNVLLLLATDV